MLRTPIIANVDDDEAGRFAVTHILRTAGYIVWEAGTAAEAYKLASAGPDIMLLDVLLPDGNGVDVCRDLKQDPKTAGITVVHMSAQRTAGTDKADGLDVGADGYIVEPVSAEELVATLKTFVRIRHSESLQRFLAKASGRLAESLDVQVSMQTLADLAVPFLNDFCVVEAYDSSSHARVAVRAHRDVSVLAAWQDATSSEAAQSSPDEDASRLYYIKQDMPPAVLAGLKPHCWMRLPLRARNTIIGMVTVGLESETCRYEHGDRVAIGDLVQRAALAIRNAQLVKEAQRRSDFEQQLIAIVSHDLRGPLQVIQLSTDLLLRSDSITERELRPARRIANAVGRMHRLIGELLDFTQARLGSGIPIVRTPVTVQTLVRQAVDDLEVAHPHRRFHVTVRDPGDAMVDSERLLQVFSNLLGNAVSHSPADKPISVSLSGDLHSIFVRINNANIEGPIPPELLAVLFEPFKRGNVRLSTRDKSFGLGLYIVDQIVRGHGGALSVTSNEAIGTTFEMKLPRA